MTRDEIAAAIAAAEATAEALRRLLAEVDGRGAPSAPAALEADREISTSVASKIMRCGYSSAYRRARKFNLAHQTANGEWKFSERAVRAFAAGLRCGENGENGDGERLPLAKWKSDGLSD